MKKVEFIELVKKAQKSLAKVDDRYANMGDGFEDGYLCDPENLDYGIYGTEVWSSEDGVGDKYQSEAFVYEYKLEDNHPIYLKFSYVMSGSYFSDFYYQDFRLEQVEKKIEIKEVVSYV